MRSFVRELDRVGELVLLSDITNQRFDVLLIRRKRTGLNWLLSMQSAGNNNDANSYEMASIDNPHVDLRLQKIGSKILRYRTDNNEDVITDVLFCIVVIADCSAVAKSIAALINERVVPILESDLKNTQICRGM